MRVMVWAFSAVNTIQPSLLREKLEGAGVTYRKIKKYKKGKKSSLPAEKTEVLRCVQDTVVASAILNAGV